MHKLCARMQLIFYETVNDFATGTRPLPCQKNCSFFLMKGPNEKKMKLPQATSPRKRPLMANSPLTYRDRRQVRYMQREMLQNMKKHAVELTELASDKFALATQELDEMYENVCYPREGNLDGLCLGELDVALGKQAHLLSGTDLTQFSISDLITATREECAGDTNKFDWLKLGEAVGSCFLSVPDTNLSFGQMDTNVAGKTQRKPPRRVIKDVVQEIRPSMFTAKSEDVTCAQARRLQILETALGRESTPKVPLFDVTLNSRSFEQTVENWFDVSFLVHRGSLGIGVDESTGLPFLEQTPCTAELPKSDQSTISITPSQWEELSAAYGSEDPFVGHRP